MKLNYGRKRLSYEFSVCHQKHRSCNCVDEVQYKLSIWCEEKTRAVSHLVAYVLDVWSNVRATKRL